MMVGLERQDSVVAQACGPTPDNYVTVRDRDALGFVGSIQAAEEEYGRGAQRDRNDGSGKIPLVPVLMQGEFWACFVTVDEAGVGEEVGKTGLGSRILGEAQKIGGHGRPGAAAVGIGRIVAIAGSVGDPAKRAAVCHRNR